MPKSKRTIRLKSPSKTPYKSQTRKSTTLKKPFRSNNTTKSKYNLDDIFKTTSINQPNTALQRSFRKTNNNSKRSLANDVQNKYTNYRFNILFHSDTIYEMIIHNIKTSIDNQPLYYCNLSIDKKNIIPNSYPKIWNQLLGHGHDGHYLVRLTSQKVAGHAVCIYKQNNEYILYDSNDYSRSEFVWFGTSKLAKAIETQNNIFVTSGYETHNNKPMLENICTLFALYTWLFEPVPQRDVLANVNSESAKMYIQYLLMKIKEKFDEYKNHDEMRELSNNIEYIVGDEQLYN
jgi:hypothetical protein